MPNNEKMHSVNACGQNYYLMAVAKNCKKWQKLGKNGKPNDDFFG